MFGIIQRALADYPSLERVLYMPHPSRFTWYGTSMTIPCYSNQERLSKDGQVGRDKRQENFWSWPKPHLRFLLAATKASSAELQKMQLPFTIFGNPKSSRWGGIRFVGSGWHLLHNSNWITINVTRKNLNYRGKEQAWKSGRRCARKDWTAARLVIVELLLT